MLEHKIIDEIKYSKGYITALYTNAVMNDLH